MFTETCLHDLNCIVFYVFSLISAGVKKGRCPCLDASKLEAVL